MVRAPSLSSVFYAPQAAPSDIDGMRRFMDDELRKIAAALSLLAAGHIDMTYAAPDKPRDGDIRLADGVSWNPGSGAGVYCYHGAAWHFLG